MRHLVASSGLGSRVRVLAEAMGGGNPVKWIINTHCPAGHRVVFPNGIQGVSIEDVKSSLHVDHTWREEPENIVANVRLIFDAMQLPAFRPLSLGVHYRGWRYRCGGDFAAFLPVLDEALKRYPGCEPVTALADSHRDDLRAVLGRRLVPFASKPLAHDLDRQPGDIRSFMLDWRRLLACSEIVSNFPRSWLLWPHRFLAGDIAKVGTMPTAGAHGVTLARAQGRGRAGDEDLRARQGRAFAG